MRTTRGNDTETQGVAEVAFVAAPSDPPDSESVALWWTPLALFLSSFALRLFHVGEFTLPMDDAIIHVPSAFTYSRLGYLGPDDWWTQPFKHVLLYAAILLFGNDPVGWRMRNVLFGAGVVLLTYLVARAMFRRRFPAITAAVLIALDPLSIAFSRNTSEDTPATFFILLACLFFIRSMKTDQDRDWILTGLSGGVALALRWYAVIPGLLMLALALVRHRREGFPSLSRILAYLGPLPLSVYTATFLPWAARGYSVGEWFGLNVDALLIQTSGLKGFAHLDQLAGPWRWFAQWMGVVVTGDRPGSYAPMFNDLPIWVMFLPAVAYLLWRGYKKRNASVLLVGGSFVLLYAFFLTVRRPILLYSSLPLLPFGAMALGFLADSVLGRRAWMFLAAAVAWCVYLFPFASGMSVPVWAYGWLLARLGWG